MTLDKPWGREIWYSGIEARGESRVRQGDLAAPLSDYLGVAGLTEVILLKELDAANGDLYLEVHELKREVYVAKTPGTLQLGMNQSLRAEINDDDAFRQAFLTATMAYEAGAAGREAVDDFVSPMPLAKGDVVVIEPWMPHSLQRGVTVIEFQTPAFERYILASNQAVATQERWDTERALARIVLDAPSTTSPTPLADGVERLAATDAFGVWRARAAVELPSGLPYVIGIVTEGHVDIDAARLDAAFLAPSPRSIDVAGEVIFGAPGL